MLAAQIEDGAVVNIILVGSLDALPGLIAGDGARIGDLWDGIKFTSPPAPSADIELEQYQAAIQVMLDAEAQSHGYDNILSACTYATCSVERFRAEGQACVDWRGSVWAAGYAILDEVTAHTIPQPSIAELLAMLPKMTWPTIPAQP